MSSERLIDLAERHFWVTVTHRRGGRTAKIEAAPTNALDVFNRPFAYTRAVAH